MDLNAENFFECKLYCLNICADLLIHIFQKVIVALVAKSASINDLVFLKNWLVRYIKNVSVIGKITGNYFTIIYL
jgi:hypothetical protein